MRGSVLSRSASFKDPLLYDTKLTREGEKQARASRAPPRHVSGPDACLGRQASSLVRRVATLSPPPQLLVASPLRRALRTAELAFASAAMPPALPRLVTPLCRERLYHSSDVGRAPAVLAAEHPTWCVKARRLRCACAVVLTRLRVPSN
jgi:broad specificity phosphatase PhoE